MTDLGWLGSTEETGIRGWEGWEGWRAFRLEPGPAVASSRSCLGEGTCLEVNLRHFLVAVVASTTMSDRLTQDMELNFELPGRNPIIQHPRLLVWRRLYGED